MMDKSPIEEIRLRIRRLTFRELTANGRESVERVLDSVEFDLREDKSLLKRLNPDDWALCTHGPGDGACQCEPPTEHPDGY